MNGYECRRKPRKLEWFPLLFHITNGGELSAALFTHYTFSHSLSGPGHFMKKYMEYSKISREPIWDVRSEISSAKGPENVWNSVSESSLNVKYEIPFMVESILINIKNSSFILSLWWDQVEILVFEQHTEWAGISHVHVGLKFQPKISHTVCEERLGCLWNMTIMRLGECWVNFRHQIFRNFTLLIARCYINSLLKPETIIIIRAHTESYTHMQRINLHLNIPKNPLKIYLSLRSSPIFLFVQLFFLDSTEKLF